HQPPAHAEALSRRHGAAFVQWVDVADGAACARRSPERLARGTGRNPQATEQDRSGRGLIMALPQGLSVGIDVLGIVLLHFLWQGAALGLVYRLLRPLCSAESARYILGLLALVALGMTPLFTAIYLWPGAVAAADMNADDVARSLQAVVAVPHASTGQLQAWLPWLVAAWLGGVITLAARSLWQWRKLLRLVHTAE